MTAVDTLAALRAAGGDLFLAEGGLKYRAPSGGLSPELKAQLQSCREELTELVRREEVLTHLRRLQQLGVSAEVMFTYEERAAILEFDAKLPRAEAEQRAFDEALRLCRPPRQGRQP